MECLRFGDYLLDVDDRRLWRDGTAVALPPRAFDTLVLLVRRAGRLVTKNDLVQEVWAGAIVGDGALTQAIWQIRQALGESYVETVPRTGYRFVALVRADAAVEPVVSNVTLLRRSSWRVALAAAALAIATVAALAIRPSARDTLAEVAYRHGLRLQTLPDLGPHSLPQVATDGPWVLLRSNEMESERLWLLQRATGALREVTRGHELYATTALSSDGSLLYYTLRQSHGPGPPTLFRAPVLGGPAEVALESVSPDFALSQDGSRVAYVADRGTDRQSLVVATLVDGERRSFRIGGSDWCDFPAWSPDSREIVLSRGDSGQREWMVAVNAASGAERPLADRGWTAVGAKAWLADGSGIVAVTRRTEEGNRLTLIELAHGTARELTHGPEEYSPWALSLSADGTIAAGLMSWQGELWLYRAPDAAGRSLVHDWRSTARFLGDRGVLFRTGSTGAARLWSLDLATSERRALSLDGVDALGEPAPDGDGVVFVAQHASTQELRWTGGDGRSRRLAADASMQDLAIPPHGDVIYFVSGPDDTLRRMPVTGGPSEVVTRGIVRNPRASPDGRWLAYWREAGEREAAQLLVVSTAGGEPRALAVPKSAARMGPLGWTPDSGYVLFVDESEGSHGIGQAPLVGGPPEPLVRFPDRSLDAIADFDLRADGALLVGRAMWHAKPVLLVPEPP
ncbi:MAG: winged helix-turn-helix domain-containing protein [Acidobacteriota bacterium]